MTKLKKNYLEKNLKTKIPKTQKFIFLSNQKFKMSQKSKTKTVEKFWKYIPILWPMCFLVDVVQKKLK